MISRVDKVQRYCSEHISKIENYDKATKSESRWDCHHKDEIDLKMSRKELIKAGKYYHVPAERLIFLRVDDHISLHMKQEDSHLRGSNNYQWHEICPIKLLYYRNNKKLSFEELSEMFGCSLSTIYRRYKKLMKTTKEKI